MADHTKNAVRAMIKALDMVAPAVDQEDPIAVEQLQSAVRYLQFLHDRIDLLYDRERHELEHYMQMAAAVRVELPTTQLRESLDLAMEHATDVLNRLGANVPEMRSATAGLTAVLRQVIQDTAGGAADVRDRLEQVVLDVTAAKIDFERAWYLPLGFDHAPGEVRPLRSLFTAGENA